MQTVTQHRQTVLRGGHSSSDTNAGIAYGTIVVRDGNADLSGLDRNPTLAHQALHPIFDAQKVQENMELGQVTGQVGMRAAGDLAQYMANHASTSEEQATWSDGGTNKTLLHGLVGAATAALGGGDALQGGLGAAAGEAASKAMSDYLISQNINPYSQEGQSLMALASSAIGGAVGGGSGAATALQGDQYNRALHPEYVHRIDQAAEKFAAEQCAASNCISVDEARNRLIYQAYRDQDATFDQVQVAQGKPNDAAAAAFLTGKASGYLDPSTGQAIDLATPTSQERYNSSLFANALYNDPQAYDWVKQATGLSDDYLQHLARRDYYGNQLPLYADQYATWQANQTLRDLINYGTPFGGVATTGELAYRGRYGEAAKEAGKEIAVNAVAVGAGKVVGAAATAIKAAIKDGKAAGGAVNVTDVLAPAKRNTGETVLGHYPEYVTLSDNLGARRYQIPDSVWSAMSEEQRWAANTKFLDRTVTRRDSVLLATPAQSARPGSYYAREIEYMKQKGYTVSDDGMSLIPPKR